MMQWRVLISLTLAMICALAAAASAWSLLYEEQTKAQVHETMTAFAQKIAYLGEDVRGVLNAQDEHFDSLLRSRLPLNQQVEQLRQHLMTMPSLQRSGQVLNQTWRSVAPQLDDLVDARDAVLVMHTDADLLSQSLPGLRLQYTTLGDILEGLEAPQSQVFSAYRAAILAASMIDQLAAYERGENPLSISEQFNTLTQRLINIGKRLHSGDAIAGVKSVDDAGARSVLVKLIEHSQVVQATAEEMHNTVAGLRRARVAALAIVETLPQLELALSDVRKNLLNYQRWPWLNWQIAALLLAASCLFSILSVALKCRQEVAQAESSFQPEAEVEPSNIGASPTSQWEAALQGDLHALDRASQEMAKSLRHIKHQALGLSDASQHQASRCQQAQENLLGNMAEWRELVGLMNSQQAQQAESPVDLSALDEDLSLSAKRVKCLAESVQELGDLVAMVEKLGEQTNMLAINATLRMARDGEAKSPHFAQLTREVQVLAEEFFETTRQAKILLSAVHTDASAGVMGVETSMQTLAHISAHIGASPAPTDNEWADSLSRQYHQLQQIAKAISEVCTMTERTSQGASDLAQDMTKAADEARQFQQRCGGLIEASPSSLSV